MDIKKGSGAKKNKVVVQKPEEYYHTPTIFSGNLLYAAVPPSIVIPPLTSITNNRANTSNVPACSTSSFNGPCTSKSTSGGVTRRPNCEPKIMKTVKSKKKSEKAENMSLPFSNEFKQPKQKAKKSKKAVEAMVLPLDNQESAQKPKKTKPIILTASKTKRSYVKKAEREMPQEIQVSQEIDLHCDELLDNVSKPTHSVTYEDVVKEAITMDLLDKRYSTNVEHNVFVRLEPPNGVLYNSNENLSLCFPDMWNEEASSSNLPPLPNDFKEEMPEYSPMKTMETISLLDSPEEKYPLFMPHELKPFPSKIFPSPLKTIKEETESVNGLSSMLNDQIEDKNASVPDNATCEPVNDTYVDDTTKSIDSDLPLSTLKIKSRSQSIDGKIDLENSLEISSDSKSNIFGDEIYKKLLSSVVENGGPPDIASDIVVVTSELKKTPKDTLEESKKQVNILAKIIEEESQNYEKKISTNKKIVTINPQDIDFNALENCRKNLLNTSYVFPYSNGTTNGRSVLKISNNDSTSQESKATTKNSEAILNLIHHDADETVFLNDETDTVEEIVVDENSNVDINACDIFMLKQGEFQSSIEQKDNIFDGKTELQEHSDQIQSEKKSEVGSMSNVEIIDVISTDNVEGMATDVNKRSVTEKVDDKDHLKEHCYSSRIEDDKEAHLTQALCGLNNKKMITVTEMENSTEVVIDPKPQNSTVQSLTKEIAGESVEMVTKKSIVKSDSELKDLKMRIMNGDVNTDEILEIIESKNIIQYNINVNVPQDEALEKQKREAKHLIGCLKKQVDVMKKTYDYFTEILDTSSKTIHQNITKDQMTNVSENLNFVKDIIDKTFMYYSTKKNNKVRYKVISITRNDFQKKNSVDKKKAVKKTSKKLLSKMLYRMNRLLSSLEKSKSRKKGNVFVNKLREVARKDYAKLRDERKHQEDAESILRSVEEDNEIQSVDLDNLDIDIIENSKQTMSTYDISKNIYFNSNITPVITPISKGVKVIFSQIEEINNRAKGRDIRFQERTNTTMEVLKDNESKRTSKGMEDDSVGTAGNQEEMVPEQENEGSFGEFVTSKTKPDLKLIEKNEIPAQSRAKHERKDENKSTLKHPEASTAAETSLEKSKKTQSFEEEAPKIQEEVDIEIIDPPRRFSTRSRKQTKFYASEVYSLNGHLSKINYEVDYSKVSPSTKKSKILKVDFDNEVKPCVVLRENKQLNTDENNKDIPKSNFKTELSTKNVKTDFNENVDPREKRQLRSNSKRGKSSTKL